MTYTAKNILIQEHSSDIWSTAISLSEKYNKQVNWIERGLLACELANVGHDYFIKRYLEEDKSVTMNNDVDVIAKELLKQERYNKQYKNIT